MVLEFLGLPGSGKTTVCCQLQAQLAANGIHAVMTKDFVVWSANQSRRAKLMHALRAPVRTTHHLFAALRFWWSLDRLSAASLRRAISAPSIAASLAYYLQATDAPVILLDQADMQGAWSIGAHASQFDGGALARLLAMAISWFPRAYVHTDADAAFAAGNIAKRSDGGSRFDGQNPEHTQSELQQAQPLMNAIAEWLRVHHDQTLTLAARVDVDQKVRETVDFVQRLIRQQAPRVERRAVADG